MKRFTDSEIATVYKVIAKRRDMRHFLPQPVDPDILERLLNAAHLAPSVGFMQPWRFVRITDETLREKIYQLVDQERKLTAASMSKRSQEFLRLKVEGIREAGEVLVAALMDGREKYIFGRRTMPEMDLASVACAIQNMWLAARAEGLGLGWVSIFDPCALARLLRMPVESKPVAILCLGHVEGFYDKPMLEQEGWAPRRPLAELLFENAWAEDVDSEND